MSSDQTPAISHVVASYMDRLNAADAQGLADLFAIDGTVMAPEVPTATGRDALLSFFDRIVAAMRFGRELHIDEVHAAGALAVVRCHTTGTSTRREPGITVEAESRELFALVDGPDGWRIQAYCFNSPAGGGH